MKFGEKKGELGRSAARRRLAALAGPAAMAAILSAGLCTGYLASRALAAEQTGYCLYTISVVPQGCQVFHVCSGVEIDAVPDYQNLPCVHSISVCGGNLALRFGSGSYSGTCPD